MAERLLWIGWDAPVRGREERGLDVFNEAVGLWGRLQQEGRIEGFDVVLLRTSGDVGGYMELHGSPAQLADVREDEAFRRVILDASMVVDRMRVIDGFTNEGVAREMEMYRESVSKVPQSA